MRALEKHTLCRWAMFLAERWLKAEGQKADGSRFERTTGTPQGGVVSPLLANLFLHYAFDKWMRRNYPAVSFERYADDIIVHCKSKAEAEKLHKAIEERLAECKLSLNRKKTTIVYTGTARTYKDYPNRKFDFLGYTFRPRLAQSSKGKQFVGFLPAISNEAKRSIRQTIRRWCLHKRTHESLDNLASMVNPAVRGWAQYYGRYYRSEIQGPLKHVEYYLKRWARSKFKKRTGLTGKWDAITYLARARKYNPYLFEHWRLGYGTTIE